MCWVINYFSKGKPVKGIKGLNVRPKIINYIKENIGAKLLDIGLSNVFVDLTQKARGKKEKIDKCDYRKLKSFCTVRKHQHHKKAIYWMTKYISKLSDKGLILKT